MGTLKFNSVFFESEKNTSCANEAPRDNRHAAVKNNWAASGKDGGCKNEIVDSRTQNIVWRFGKIGEKNKCKEFFKSSVFPCVPTEKRIKWKQDSKK